MEFVVVKFPVVRSVNVDGAPQGKTGKVLRLQAGTHRFDLGAPADYKPASQTIRVIGTSMAAPMEVVFELRTGPRAARRRKPRRRAAARVPARRARRAPAKRAPKVASGAPGVRGITFRTPTRTFSFNPTLDEEKATKTLQRAAMQWTYVLRNRQRWSALPVSAKHQAERARVLLNELGMSDADLQTIATDRVVEVAVPFSRETENWEARVFPWEFVLAGATRDARHGEALTVMRRLVSKSSVVPARVPQRVLYVQSTPGKLRDLYDFDTERKLVRSNLRVKDSKNWQELLTPTLDALRGKVTGFRPDIIHLAGFDSHQGLRLLRPTVDQKNGGEETPPRTQRERDTTPDGYLMSGANGEPVAVDAQALAGALCAEKHRPELVAFSLQNSAARVASMAVAHGAHAAIGFQDMFDDNLAELFFGSFYRAWRKGGWELAAGFRTAWEIVRAQPHLCSDRGSCCGARVRLSPNASSASSPQRDARPLRRPRYGCQAQFPSMMRSA